MIKFDDGSEESMTMNDFNINLPENFRENFCSQIDSCYSITKEDIKSEYFPNFENNNSYLYLEKEDIYLIYDNYNDYLIVFITAQ